MANAPLVLQLDVDILSVAFLIIFNNNNDYIFITQFGRLTGRFETHRFKSPYTGADFNVTLSAAVGPGQRIFGSDRLELLNQHVYLIEVSAINKKYLIFAL
jgi:hypothetical protein